MDIDDQIILAWNKVFTFLYIVLTVYNCIPLVRKPV